MSVSSSSKRTYMRSDDRREQILQCAREVFAERGFHLTSVADICERAGIGRGTLYQHFNNKRDVFFAVVDEIAQRVALVTENRTRVAQIDGAEAAPPQLIAAYCARRLRDLLEAVFSDEASVRLVLREARGLDGGIDRLVERVDAAVLEAFVADLQTARAMGVFTCTEPRLTAMFVIGGVEKMVLADLGTDEPLDLDRIIGVAIQLQLFGLLSEETRKRAHGVNDSATPDPPDGKRS